MVRAVVRLKATPQPPRGSPPVPAAEPAPTDPAQVLALEYERFVEFGQVLDRTGRRYLVAYLRHRLEPDRPLPPELDDAYFRYFRRALEGALALDALAELCRGNPGLRRQVASDTLRWLRVTYQELRAKHPYDDEVARLGAWAVTPLAKVRDRWPVLTTYLERAYPPEELPVGFFREAFARLSAPGGAPAPARGPLAPTPTAAPGTHDWEPLLKDLLAQWDALLHAKILAHQLRHLGERADDFRELVGAKVAEYQRLVRIVSPFSEHLAGYWDMSRSLWRDTNFDVLEHYADLLAREDELRELADLLGQWREAELEVEEETLERTIARQRWVRDPALRAEISGVHESADLSALVSSEAALLADADTEGAFLKRFADRQLLTFRYDDRRLVASPDHETEVYNRVRERERGPFILCVDTSESMGGRPEQVAKVLALGILKMAGRVGRRAYLINFSTGIQTLDLHDVARSLDAIADFLRMSFRGGTDVSLPLYECFRQLRGDDYRDADVLVISDFIMVQLDDDILAEMRHFQQNKATEFHGLVLGRHGNPQVVDAFDTTWQYDGEGVVRRVARDLLAS